MKDDQTHIIKSLQYSIELDDASQGYGYQSKVSQLQEYSIRAILQNVMDSYHVPEYLDQYNNIVLDLGTISASNFDREISYKIEEAFIDFFKNNTYDNGTLIKGKRKPIYKTQMDQFVFFLKNGYLKWDTPSSTSPLELLTAALHNHKEALIIILKEEGKKESVRKRLISQLKDPALEEIVIAIKEKEGIYINQYRNDIVEYQENHTIVEINKGYFRNAIWEITLAYIFTEVTGYSNQTNFLKYLIQKIAIKYNLTYKSLLKKIVLGIKKSQNEISALPNFGKIAIQLHEEEEKREATIYNTSKPNRDIDFIATFQYYLKYNALPVNSEITTFDIFSKNLEHTIHVDSDKFYTVFYEFIQKNSNIDLFINRLSDTVVTTIIVKAPDEILVTITQFYNQILDVSNKLSIKSKTLDSLQKRLGKMSLQAYAVVRKTSTSIIRVFLYQIIKDTVVDQEFIRILKALKNENEFKNNKVILSFIDEIAPKSNRAKDKEEVIRDSVFTEISKKLYTYHKRKEIISLKLFQIELVKANYSKATFKLTIVLLEAYSIDGGTSKQILLNKTQKQLLELKSKGENIEIILSQVYKLSQALYLDDAFLGALEETRKVLRTLKEFQTEQAKLDYREVSYQLVKLLQDVYNQGKGSSKQVLKGWLQQRLLKLKSKGEKIEVILSQVYTLSQTLSLDKAIIEVLEETKKTVIALNQFQTELAVTDYSEASYKLVVILLEVYSKDKSCSKQALKDWIQQRLFELKSKGEKVETILFQMYKMAQTLSIDNKVLEAIKESKTSYLKQDKKAEAPIEHKGASANPIPLKVYHELLDAIKSKLFNREQDHLYESIRELLELFSKKNNIEKHQVLEALKKDSIAKHISEFVKEILENITDNKQKVAYKVDYDDRYYLDSIQYFFTKGRLPWWVENKSSIEFRKSMLKVLNEYPERFISWFKTSKHQKVIIDLMDDSIYNVFIKQTNSSVTQSVIATKQLFETLLEKDLSGIKNILPAHYRALRYIVLDYIQHKKQIESPKMTAYIISKLAEIIAVTKEDLYQLLLGRIRYDKTNSNSPETIEPWLLTVIKEPKAEFKDVIQKIESEKPWKDAISFSSSKELINNLEGIYKARPQELFFHIKQATFRKRLISKLGIKEQKEVIKLFFSVAERSQLLTVFEIFKKLRKQITANNYQVVWSHFVDKLLLKIAMRTSTNWSVNDWSLLLFNSLSSIQHSNTLSELIAEVSVYNNTASEHILNEVQSLIAQKEEQTKQEGEDNVPEAIEEEAVGESIFIENAGMVILGPYISMLFERMGLLENRTFKNDACQQKAMYALQYAVTGKTDPEEHALLLNKIICGMDIHTPIGQVISLKDEEKALIDGLLKAIIAHWNAIGNTSVEGLRASFLCRGGRVTIEEEKYILVVEEKSYDMLLDNIPWTIGQLKLSWMQKLVEVIWRS